MNRTYTRPATDRSQLLILGATLGLVLLTSLLSRIAETRQVRPEGALQIGLLGLLVLVAASVGALVGQRLFSRPTAALLGAVGGGLAGMFVNPVLGACGGFVVGLLVSLRLVSATIRIAAVFGSGLLGVCLARRIHMDASPAWFWINMGFLLAIVVGQLLTIMPLLRRQSGRERTRIRWIRLPAFIVCALLLIVASWISGWHVEFYRRLGQIEERGGSIYLDWRGASPVDLFWGRPIGWVSIRNPSRRDWATIAALSAAPSVGVSGADVDDTALAGMPLLPNTARLSIANANVRGSFLAERKMPNLTDVSFVSTPLDDAAMRHVGQLQLLTSAILADTRVTGAGLARLSGLSGLRSLRLSGQEIKDEDLRGLVGIPLTSLHLDCPQLTAAGIERLQDLPGLADLRLASPVDDAAIRALAQLRVTTLAVYIAQLTPDTVAAFKRLPASVTLQVYVPHRQTKAYDTLKRRLPKARISTY